MWASVALVGGLTALRRHRLSAEQLELSPSVVRD
jgi:hypothetical protein